MRTLLLSCMLPRDRDLNLSICTARARSTFVCLSPPGPRGHTPLRAHSLLLDWRRRNYPRRCGVGSSSSFIVMNVPKQAPVHRVSTFHNVHVCTCSHAPYGCSAAYSPFFVISACYVRLCHNLCVGCRMSGVGGYGFMIRFPEIMS